MLHAFGQALPAVLGLDGIRSGRVEYAQHDAFGEMGQFAYVAGPVMRHEMLLDRGWHLRDVALEAAGGMPKVVREQQRDVFPAFTQWRNADRDHVQPVKQVFAKLGAYGRTA
ncbi:hypothetical protein D3C87_1169140 [compost metagenome]